MSKEQNQDLNLFGEVHPLLPTPAEGTEGQVPLRCPLATHWGAGGGTAGGLLRCQALPYTPRVHGAQLAVVGAGHTSSSWTLGSSR